jgi:glycine oxidase
VTAQKQVDVVVVGAGIIGCAIARELAGRGVSTLVVERDSPGRRATWAAAGMLSPFGEGASEAFIELADDSLHRFAGFVQALHEESGIDVEYRTAGKLHVATSEQPVMLHAMATEPGAERFDVSLMDGDAARRLEPALSEEITTAVLVGRDHRVNNRLLAQSLLASAVAAGVTFRTANPVTALMTRQGQAAGVRLASGEQIDAGHVVIAAGAWSSQLEGLPRELPVRPVKGQMFAVDARARSPDRPSAPVLQRVIQSEHCYIIPRDDGRLLVGASVEDVGFRKGPTPRGIGALIAAAVSVLPLTADLPLVETWAGFRPATPDNLPILGFEPLMRGLIYATGHYRNGILLTPVTAQCVADLVTHGRTAVPLDAFGITRFGGTP